VNLAPPSTTGGASSPSMPDLPAIFLGLPGGTRDDRVLLGVPLGGVLSREQVLCALKDRLQRVSHHSLAATPEAAELRMMLHAGVARLLLSPAVRVSQDAAFGLAPVERASVSAMTGASVGGVSVSGTNRLVSDPMRDFDELATLTLAKHGGWNPAAAQEISMLASAMGVAQDRVPSILTNLATLGGPASRAAVNVPGRYPTQATAALREAVVGNQHVPPRVEETKTTQVLRDERLRAAVDEFEIYRTSEDPARRMLRNGLIGAVVGLLFLVVAAMGLRIMFAGKGSGAGGASNAGVSNAPVVPQANGNPVLANTSNDAVASGAGRVSQPNVLTGVSSSAPLATGSGTGAGEFRAGEVLAQMREAAGVVQDQPARSGEQLVLALEAMGQGWPAATASDVVAAGDATAEFTYRAGSILGPSREEALEPLVRSLESGLGLMTDGSAVWTRERIRRASFSCGVTARLLGERDLPSALRVRLRKQLATALGGALPTDQATVRQSVGAALDRMSGLMVGMGKPMTVQPGGGLAGELGGQLGGTSMIASQQAIDAAWLSWAQCAKALLADSSPDEYTQLLLLALDRSMTSGNEPSLDPMIAGAIDQLARQLPLDASGPAKPAVLRWMTQAEVSSVDLHVLTSALVQRSDSGLELTATLSASATLSDRELLRDRYANLWQISESGTQQTLSGRWLEEARAILGSDSGGVPQGSFKERLAFAVRLSTLNTAAVEVMRGEWSSASLTLERARSPISRWDTGGGLQLGQGSSSWGEQYVGAGNDIPKRREILQAVRGPVSALEARIVVEEAMRAGSPEVRRDARAVLQRALEQPEVLKALLDFQPFIPATRDNGKLLEAASASTLPAPKAAQWRVEVRRGLLRRLLEVLAPDDGLFVDVAADSFLTDYRARITVVAATTPAGDDDEIGSDAAVEQRAIEKDRPTGLPQLRSVPAELLAAARRYQAQIATHAQRGWFADPAFVSVQDAMRVRDGRLVACETDLQRFVVEQNAIIELQARTVAMDNRAAKDQAVLVLEAWRRDASGSLHVFDQMAAGELAQARLWMLRFGAQLSGGQPGGLLISPTSAPTNSSGGTGAGSAGS